MNHGPWSWAKLDGPSGQELTAVYFLVRDENRKRHRMGISECVINANDFNDLESGEITTYCSACYALLLIRNVFRFFYEYFQKLHITLVLNHFLGCLFWDEDIFRYRKQLLTAYKFILYRGLATICIANCIKVTGSACNIVFAVFVITVIISSISTTSIDKTWACN